MQKIITCCLVLMSIASCKNRETTTEDEVIAARTPVTVTGISNEPMEESVELNAVSSFLQKWIVRANATGYSSRLLRVAEKAVAYAARLPAAIASRSSAISVM